MTIVEFLRRHMQWYEGIATSHQHHTAWTGGRYIYSCDEQLNSVCLRREIMNTVSSIEGRRLEAPEALCSHAITHNGDEHYPCGQHQLTLFVVYKLRATSSHLHFHKIIRPNEIT